MALDRTRVELLNRVAERNEQAALEALRSAEGRLAEHRGLRGELERYLDEYQQRPFALANPFALENRRQFLAKLDAALGAQASAVAAAEAEVGRRREAWLATRRELRISHLLDDQVAAAERAQAERINQRETDEFAMSRRPHTTADAR